MFVLVTLVFKGKWSRCLTLCDPQTVYQATCPWIFQARVRRFLSIIWDPSFQIGELLKVRTLQYSNIWFSWSFYWKWSWRITNLFLPSLPGVPAHWVFWARNVEFRPQSISLNLPVPMPAIYLHKYWKGAEVTQNSWWGWPTSLLRMSKAADEHSLWLTRRKTHKSCHGPKE